MLPSLHCLVTLPDFSLLCNTVTTVNTKDSGQANHTSKTLLLETFYSQQLAILFSGATPGKVLRMLNYMKLACFTDRTFYYHQK